MQFAKNVVPGPVVTLPRESWSATRTAGVMSLRANVLEGCVMKPIRTGGPAVTLKPEDNGIPFEERDLAGNVGGATRERSDRVD